MKSSTGTVEFLTQRLKYARYTPMLYYTGEDTPDQVGDTGPKEHGALYENPAGQTAGQQLSRVPKLDCPFHLQITNDFSGSLIRATCTSAKNT